jgi:hypothetical protein
MNLEVVEHKCLLYLKQAANPLVPVATLLNHLRNDTECGEVTECDLLGFLRKHELFKVLEAPRDLDPDEAAELAELGIVTGPRVILTTRIPTKAEIAAAITEHMDRMTDALAQAQENAQRREDPEAEEKVREILDRAEDLKKKFKDLL